MAVLAISPNEAEFDTADASIKVNIQTNIFTYTVTNLSDTPITAVEFPQHATYNLIAPEGWETAIRDGAFHSWVVGSTAGILPRKKEEFSMRVSSRGAVLNRLPAKIEFELGKTVVVADVWSSVPEPTSYVLFIAGVIAALYLAHSLFVSKGRKKMKASIS